ncbi:hypothetical protein CspHIS471_0102110 [Cutaneotrichosporon sp. HIS471]|nr:hypothetical protein CspHIS471_0102110 [Cutaneotrichosporon sp. HIS471]
MASRNSCPHTPANSARPSTPSTPSTALDPLQTPSSASYASTVPPTDGVGTMLGVCCCCGQQTDGPGPGAPSSAPCLTSEDTPDSPPDGYLLSCFPLRKSRQNRQRQRQRQRRPASPPPPSSHSVVPPTRLGRWRLQARARVRLQAARLAQVTRWRARINNPAIVLVPPEGSEDTVPPEPRWRLLTGLPSVRFRLPPMPSMSSLLRRRTSDASIPEPEIETPPSEYAASEITCHTRRTSLDYDAFGPTIADRLKSQPRRNSW